MNLPRLSVRNQTVVWILVFMMAAWGLVSFLTISRREDPDIKISMALVVTIWPGASAEKVERLVTKKLEDQFESMSTLREQSSQSRENLSVIFVNLDFAADVTMGWQILRNKIEEVRPDLPSGIIGPDVIDDFGDVTAMIWSLSSATAAPADLERWAEALEAELRKVPSVGKIELLGVQQEAIYIEGPLASFTTYGFSPFMAARILDASNVNMPSGYFRTDTRNFRLDTSGSFSLEEDLRQAVIDVSETTGHPLRVGDVFNVRRAYKEPPLDLMYTNGVLSVGLDVRMKTGQNIVAMGEAAKQVAWAFAERLPKDIKLTLIHDQPREVDHFINTFLRNLLEGLVIVVVVMFLAMGVRTTLIVAVSLPLSIIVTFAFMPLFDVDLETVSIASFIVALGMLVDNAIIVTDNIFRKMEEGMPRAEAAVVGSQEIIIPVVAGTLGTVFAFLPLLLMKEETGAYIRALPIVVSLSLGASLVLAVTVTPVLAARLLRVKRKRAPFVPSSDANPPEDGAAAHPAADGAVAEDGAAVVPLPPAPKPPLGHRLYGGFMRAGMRLRYLVVLAAIAGFSGAVMLMPEVGMSFFPESDRDQFTVDIRLPEGSSLTDTERVVREVEAILRSDPDVKDIVSYVGKGGPRFFITIKPEFNATNYAQVVANTTDALKTRAVVARLDAILQRTIVGARVRAENLIMGIPVDAPVAIRVSGPDLNVMREISARIQEILRNTPGTLSVRDNLGEEVASLSVEVDATSANMAGVTGTEVAAALVTAYEGLPVTNLRAGKREVPVYLRLNEAERGAPHVLEQMAVPSQATGGKVPLGAFATVRPQWSSGLIRRDDNRRSVMVLSNLHGRLAQDVIAEAWPQVLALPRPAGYDVEIAGEEAERAKAFDELSVIFALIIGLLLLMLTVQFNSVKRALAVLITVPLAIIGAILGLYWSYNSFSFMAFLGVISLAGMVVKNAVVWVEFVDQAMGRGHSLADAIVEAGIVRFRPIMLTALTTIGGLVPLALFGGVLWEGMAWAMIVGLALATLLTLVVNPILFYTLFRGSERRKARARAAAAVAVDPPATASASA